MPIVTPGKRPGVRLSKSKIFGMKGGFGRKKSGYAGLNLTPMVDMFTIIVIYLLQNFSTDGEILFMSKEIQLPTVTSKIQLERAPVVSISADSILVDGQKVIDTAELTRDATMNVPVLEEVMQEKKRTIQQSAALFNNTEGFKDVVNIQADKGVKFQVLKKVMFACNVAGFGTLKFAGMTVSAPNAATKSASNP